MTVVLFLLMLLITLLGGARVAIWLYNGELPRDLDRWL